MFTQYPCPDCGATKGSPCVGKRGGHVKPHAARRKLWNQFGPLLVDSPRTAIGLYNVLTGGTNKKI